MPPFSFGDPQNPREDDPRFDDETDAIQATMSYQCAHYRTGEILHAVWDDDGGEVIALVFDRIVYTP